MTANLLQSGNVTLHVFTDEQLRAYSINLINEVLEAKSPKQEEETYLSIEEACRFLNVTKPTLWRWEKSQYLVPSRIGSKPRYKKSELIKVMEG